jgi:hypothetical protein
MQTRQVSHQAKSLRQPEQRVVGLPYDPVLTR